MSYAFSRAWGALKTPQEAIFKAQGCLESGAFIFKGMGCLENIPGSDLQGTEVP